MTIEDAFENVYWMLVDKGFSGKRLGAGVAYVMDQVKDKLEGEEKRYLHSVETAESKSGEVKIVAVNFGPEPKNYVSLQRIQGRGYPGNYTGKKASTA